MKGVHYSKNAKSDVKIQSANWFWDNSFAKDSPTFPAMNGTMLVPIPVGRAEEAPVPVGAEPGTGIPPHPRSAQTRPVEVCLLYLSGTRTTVRVQFANPPPNFYSIVSLFAKARGRRRKARGREDPSSGCNSRVRAMRTGVPGFCASRDDETTKRGLRRRRLS
jgi:hypothetical protein